MVANFEAEARRSTGWRRPSALPLMSFPCAWTADRGFHGRSGHLEGNFGGFSPGMSCPRFGSDLLCLGEMGIGHDLGRGDCLALGGRAGDRTGPGAGWRSALTNKAAVVEKAVDIHRDRIVDGHCGFWADSSCCCRRRRLWSAPRPRSGVLDGSWSAAAARLNAVNERRSTIVGGPQPRGTGHRKLLDKLEDRAGFEHASGEGPTPLPQPWPGGGQLHVGMATFEEAGVSEKTD